jgi:hypothetical protein
MGWGGRLIPAAGALVCLALGGGCSDVFDVDVDLQQASFTVDFGSFQGTVPAVACDASAPATCTAAAVGAQALAEQSGVGPTDTQITGSCDAATSQCYALVDTHTAVSIDTLTGNSLGTRLARHGTSFVHTIDVRYTVPANTLAFDLPSVDVFIGPPGSSVDTDSGVTAAGTLAPIAAGTTFTQMRHLVVGDGTPAHALVEDSMRAERPIVVILQASPRADAGARLPTGTLQVVVYPRITVGL